MNRHQADEKPSQSIRDTYTRLREWYQAYASILLELAPPASQREAAIKKSFRAIDGLPPESELTDLEVRVVLFEITSGVLNWSYWDKCGDRAIYELVASTLHRAGYPKDIGETNRKAFRASESVLKPLFPNF